MRPLFFGASTDDELAEDALSDTFAFFEEPGLRPLFFGASLADELPEAGVLDAVDLLDDPDPGLRPLFFGVSLDDELPEDALLDVADSDPLPKSTRIYKVALLETFRNPSANSAVKSEALKTKFASIIILFGVIKI